MYTSLFNRQTIEEYLPDISALAGVKEIEYASGPAKGVRALEVYTGSGFRFVVIPDRGMDVAEASYKGIPISWVGKQGIYAPQFFQNGELEFMKVFFAGLITTCGLTQAGKPCIDESITFGKEAYGLHGRINAIPAENYWFKSEWENEDDYVITISGRVRQARLYGENLLLEREIKTKLGSSEITISDTVINEGHVATEFMMLYHLNFGYPVVSENTRLSTNYRGMPINDFAKAKDGVYKTFGKPVPRYFNDNYWLLDPEDDDVRISLFNENIGLGVSISYLNSQLPFCTEWINLAAQDYVVGLEPGNCLPEGRVKARKNGRLDIIEPKEKKEFKLQINIVDNCSQ